MLSIKSSQLNIEELILNEARDVRNKYPQCSNSGKCLDAVNELQQRISALGISCAAQFGTFNGKRHSWLDVWTNEGVKILDITADQWGDDIPEVVWGNIQDLPQYGWE